MPGPTNNPSQQKKRRTKPRNIWQHVSPEEAAGKSDGLSSHHIAADIYVEHLVLNGIQKSDISLLYQNNKIEDHLFTTNTPSQDDAAILLGVHGLHIGCSEDLSTKWAMQWSRDSGSKRKEVTRRALYQW